MSKISLPKRKMALLVGIMGFYILLAGILFAAVSAGLIPRGLPSSVLIVSTDTIVQPVPVEISAHLQSAQQFFENNFVASNEHISLYVDAKSAVQNRNVSKISNQLPNNVSTQTNSSADTNLADNTTATSLSDNTTNSEAASYYLLWTANANDKVDFDKELAFIQTYMVQPKFAYLMWHLNANDKAVGDGSNIATDADLRAIKALLIAEKQWKDVKYTQMIDQLASGIEKVGLTKDGYLAPYGGVSGENSTWTADEVWLSYSDFTVFRELSTRRGTIWTSLYEKMKDATLKAQIANGLYNNMLTNQRAYGNGIDGGGYSINSLWMMVRSAESKDTQLMHSANLSLQFYESKFGNDAALYAQYDSDGNPLSASDNSWVYALVGRAAIALGDKTFSELMIRKLLEHQVASNLSQLFGAFPEGFGDQTRVGQFTMQESILTLQAFTTNNLNS